MGTSAFRRLIQEQNTGKCVCYNKCIVINHKNKYICNSIFSIVTVFKSSVTPVPVILLKTTSSTEIELSDLLDRHIYNISVSAATEGGTGQPVFLQVTTCK